MSSPFGSINQQQVIKVLEHAGYAGGAAVVADLLNSVGNVHFNGFAAILVTAGLVPTLVFLKNFFSGQGSTVLNGTVIDTAPPANPNA